MKSVLEIWDNRPLILILLVGLMLRLIAVIFSGGYSYHDDHFLVIEYAQGWVDGRNPGNIISETPAENNSGRSLVYPGAVYLLFSFLEFTGTTDPEMKMWVNRLLHALYSMLTIILGYRLALHYSDLRKARMVGLLLACFWLFPQISVRNLVEVIPIPLMLLSSLWIARYKPGQLWRLAGAGLLLGLCFTFRYQTIFFTGGIGIGLLLMKRWKETAVVAFAVLLAIVLIHGVGDIFLCGAPFCKLIYYVQYNIHHATAYINELPGTYFLIILGMMIPPLSFLLMFGFLRAFKIDRAVWLGSLLFLVFHSFFPNKQERFIFTILPFFILLGYLGWMQFQNSRTWSVGMRKFIRVSWIIFWMLNIPLVFLYSGFENKRARISAMELLAEQGDLKSFVLIDPERKDTKDAPIFYAQTSMDFLKITSRVTKDSAVSLLSRIPDEQYPNYVIIGHRRGEDRSEKETYTRQFFPRITYMDTKTMDYVDYWRNAISGSITLDDWSVYRIEGPRAIPFDPGAEPLPVYYQNRF